jgi:DNA-binding LytR/AlgR family response regulator
MNVFIVEDEHIAAEKLRALLQALDHDINIVGHAKSIVEGCRLIKELDRIDLAFFDIQLEDGLSFSILEQIKTTFPIVFTTAYDDYAIRAFDHHSIAYLLKPIQKSDLEKALEKLRSTQQIIDYSEILLTAIREARKPEYKQRFTVKVGDKIRLFDVNEIACFYSRDKGTFLFTKAGKQFLVDFPLDRLEVLIDPLQFYRVNRKHFIHVSAIEKVIQHSNSRQKIILQPAFDEDIIVARERVKDFKNWLEGL